MLYPEHRQSYDSSTNDCHIGAMVERGLLKLEKFASRPIPNVQNQIYVGGRYELLKYLFHALQMAMCYSESTVGQYPSVSSEYQAVKKANRR